MSDNKAYAPLFATPSFQIGDGIFAVQIWILTFDSLLAPTMTNMKRVQKEILAIEQDKEAHIEVILPEDGSMSK